MQIWKSNNVKNISTGSHLNRMENKNHNKTLNQRLKTGEVTVMLIYMTTKSNMKSWIGS